MKPEYRLRPLPVGAVLLPVGLFIYGWTAEYHTHWIAPVSNSISLSLALGHFLSLLHILVGTSLTLTVQKIIGTAVMGVANIIIFMGLNLALVDTFTIYAASALAANTVVRSVAGAVLPVSVAPIYGL